MNRFSSFVYRVPVIWFVLGLVLVVSVPLAVFGGAVPAIVGGINAFFAGLILVKLAGYDPDAHKVAESLGLGSTAEELLERWLRRSRYFRFVGGLSGYLAGSILTSGGAAWIFVLGLGGVALGGALAEVHSLKPPAEPERTADLSVRNVKDYVALIDVLAAGAVAAGAVAITVVSLFADKPGATRWGIAALVVLGLTALMQQLVVRRRRPALSEELRAADDLMRRLAATQGFMRPAIALSFGLLAESAHAYGGSGTDASSGTNLAWWALWLLGFVWYIASRRSAAKHTAKRMART